MTTISDNAAQLHDVRGNAALLFDDPHIAWKVHAGSVAVFAVHAVDGQPAGPRRYLFSCNQGDLLFGNLPDELGETLHFLGVSLEDSQLAKCPLTALAEATGYAQADLALRVDTWVTRISSLLAESGWQAHAEKAALTGPLSLSPGQEIKPPPQTVLWMCVRAGTVLVAGHAEHPIAAGSDWIPLADPMQVTAQDNVTLQFRRTNELESTAILAQGIQRLHHLSLRRLQQLEQEEAAEEAERLAQGRALQSRDTLAAIDELSVALSQRPSQLTAEDDLMGSLQSIGNQLGVSFRRSTYANLAAPLDDQVEGISRASRVRARRVRLRGSWWQEDAGPILGRLHAINRVVALLREGENYVIHDPVEGTRRRVSRANEQELDREATTFVRPLPDKTTSIFALGHFAMRPIARDMLLVMFVSLTITILGMLTPFATQLIIDQAIPDANLFLLYQLAIGLLAMTIGQAALSFSQNNVLLRTDTAATAGLQAAVIDRLVRLPARFFRKYSSGDLQNRAMMVTQISQSVGHAAVGGILSGAMASLNLVLCFIYSPYLAMIGLISALIVAAYTAGLSMTIRTTARRLGVSQGRLFGFQVQLVTGVSKLRVAGAEQRAFNHWAREQAKQLRMLSTIQRIEQWGAVVNSALSQGSVITLYYFAATMLAGIVALQGGSNQVAPAMLLTMGSFLAFYAAFMALIGGMTHLSRTIVDLMDSFAKRRLILPLLEEKPENDETKVDPGRLEGGIAVNAVSFHYRKGGQLVLNEVSLHAHPGEFIAIVGPSGCGKSTLLRMLLGFETPQSGTVSFDGQDLASLDGTAVRRQIGVVLQSGVLNAGSIFSNIAGASQITLDEAWEAARAAGLAEDVEQMPMGMHTYLGEGGGTLSGGQRQRLLIARSLVHKPKILIFDEATSALDNRTQQIVSASVDRLNVTRIVVAHRLSTIRDASRIYVLEDGKVSQVGTFGELSQREGLFRRMIARQIT